MDCLFCEIIKGAIPTKKVYEDEKVLAFYDINPQAKIHVLVVPKLHIPSANELNAENCGAVADVFAAVPKIAEKLGIDSYRIINNCGEAAGQTVKHLHFHLLFDEKLGEKLI